MSSSAPVKNVLILGATGPLGLAITREALSHNLHPTLFIRNPSKIPSDISEHPDVTIIKGTLPSAPTTLFPTLSSRKFTTIISALGPNTFYRTPKYEISTFYTTLLNFLSSSSYPHAQKPYILALSTPYFSAVEDRFCFASWFLIYIISLVIPGFYIDVRANASVFLEFEEKRKNEGGEEVKWTVYRVGHLSDEIKEKGDMEGKGRVARVGYVGDEGWGMWVDREGVARWVVGQAEAVEDGREEVEEGDFGLKWVGKVPVLGVVWIARWLGF